MRHLFAWAAIGILFILSVAGALASNDEQPKPPFIGKIKIDNVNIRAGGDQNFEILAKVNSDDLVKVTEESYGWYKIKLPQSAACYAAVDFIEKNQTGGVSKASNLNIRAKPNREASIIGQLKKGDAVLIINEGADGWYQIKPPENCFGWVRMDLVEYYSSIEDKAAQGEAIAKDKPKYPPQSVQTKDKPKKQKKGWLW